VRRPAFLALALFASGAIAPLAGTQDFGIFEPSGSGASGGGGSGSTSSTGTGGCSTSSDCDDSNPCTTDTCSAGKCTNAPVADGSKPNGVTDTVGDCKKPVCQGGQSTVEDDDTDVPDDAKECTADACNNGSATHDPVQDGTPCGGSPTTTCQNGVCVGCMSDNDCNAPECQTATCQNQVCVNGNEPSGTPCNNGNGVCDGAGVCEECVVDDDCNDPALICTNNQCVNSCNDSTTNGTETDQDCGGACPPCADGLMCALDEDCASGVCTGTTCTAPSCTDLLQNGDETDVDCGGACAMAPTSKTCPDGDKCLVNADCASNFCRMADHLCYPATCNNAAQDAPETDVDCGGGTCPQCTANKKCVQDSDCTSNNCKPNNTCQ
jgi:hypothetical protein